MARRSAQVEIGFVSAVAAAAIAGCNPFVAYHREWQQCVNQANVVVEDRLCDTRYQPTGGYYHWWYSPSPYGIGSYVSNGYATSLDPASVGHASSVTRGGFGSSGFFGGGIGE